MINRVIDKLKEFGYDKSRGEKYIETQLLLNNIKYKEQKRFNDCKNVIPLPFDFCIEFDGIHHYQIKNVHGGFDRLVKQKENDRIKTKYCKDNNIKLFRIKYTDDIKKEVQNILDYIKKNKINEI